MIKKLKRSHLGWLVAIALIAMLMSRLNLSDLEAALKSLTVGKVLSIALLVTAGNAMQGIRFYFWGPTSKPASMWRQALLTSTIHTGNILFPLRAGETVRPLTLMKWDPSLKFKDIVYWTLTDRILEIVSLLPFVTALAFYFNHYSWLALGASCVATIAFFVTMATREEKPRSMFPAYICSLLSWCFNCAVFFVLVSTIPGALGLLLSTSIASSIPGIPAGIGTYHAAFVWAGGLVGIAASQAMALAIATHTVSMIATLCVGLPVGAKWGWPSKRQQMELMVQVAPATQKLNNIVVYICAAFTVIFSGAFWIPEAQLKRKNGKRVNS